MSASVDERTIEARKEAARWQDGRHQREPRPFRRLFALAVGVATVAIFALDTFTPMSSAIAVLYMLVLVVAHGRLTRAALRLLGAVCVALSVTSFLTDHDLMTDGAATVRLGMSLLAVITTTRLLERNLEARQRFEAQALLLDATTDAIVLRDLAGRVLLWNRGAERLFGLMRASVMDLVHHDLLESAFPVPIATIDDELRQGGAWEGEIRQIRSDGVVLTIASHWTLQRDQRGLPWAVLETSTDVTARKAIDQALMQSERRYRSIFDTLAVAVLEYDFSAVASFLREPVTVHPQHRPADLKQDVQMLAEIRRRICVVNANPTALNMMGLASADRSTRRRCDFLPFDDETLMSLLGALETGGTIFERDVIAPGPDGKMLALIIAFHFPPRGEPLDRIQCSMIDLTEHRRMADDLARTRSDLEHALRVATIGEVSATIAHEINQPLAAIRTYAEAAQRWLGRGPGHHGDAVEALKEVANAAGHAGEIVRGVRRLLGRSAREDRPVAIDEIIVGAVQLVRREIVECRAIHVLDLAADGVHVLGDRLLLQQAIINLVGNALHAVRDSTGPRELRIASAVEGDMVSITVSDTGPGFSADIISEALNAFATTTDGGMGLGLAICRSVMEAHGGMVRIANAPTGGAVVTLTLPVAVQARPSTN